MKKLLPSLVVAVFFVSLLLPLASATTEDVRVNQSVRWGGNITIGGYVLNESDRGDGEAAVNLSIALNGAQRTSNNSGANGTLWFNLTAPETLGQYNLSISDNGSGSGVHSRVFSIFITNLSNVTFTYGTVKPPFNNGSSFVVNVTCTHFNGSVAPGYNPLFEIFSANGVQQAWTVTNTSTGTNTSGVKSYNVTVPATASGAYIIVIDRGVGTELFQIKSLLKLAVTTESATGEVLAAFPPGSLVRIHGKVRDSNGNPVTGATVTASLTLPNSTTLNITLSEYNSTGYPGFYAYNYTTGSSEGVYQVKVVAAAAGAVDISASSFGTRLISATLSPLSTTGGGGAGGMGGPGMFLEWGGQKAIRTGGAVAFNLIVTNLSSDAVLVGAPSYNVNNGTVNCTSVTNVTIAHTNGTVIASPWLAPLAAGTNFTNGTYGGTTVCQLAFVAPSRAGTYVVSTNVTVNGSTSNASAVFTVQDFVLKARSVSSFGGGDFMQVFSPGDNVTFSISAFNLTSNSVVTAATGNFTNLQVRSIRQIETVSGSQELNTTSWTTCANRPCIAISTSPQATITIPSVTGMLIAEFVANVSGDNITENLVTGNAFILSKYVEGFASPQAMGFGSGGGLGGEMGGGSMGGQGAPASKCSGTETFMGFARDLKTNQNAQGVIINGVSEAREEATGKDISGCLSVSQTVSNSTSTGSNINFNVTFASNSSCSFSGYYFAMFNITYQGNYDVIPSGFKCSQLSFFPQVVSATRGTSSWSIGSNESFNITVSNVRRGSDGAVVNSSASYASVRFLESFSPASGRIIVPAAIPINVSLATGFANLTINTTAFGLSKWPNGFMMFSVTVNNGTISGSSEAGTQSVAFNAYPYMSNWGMSSTVPGDVYNITIMAQTNLSTVGNFTVKVGRPWEGQVSDATVVGANLLNDSWNKTDGALEVSGPVSEWLHYETWVINFTIPADAPKGFSPALITINNSLGETVEQQVPLQIVKYTVAVPDEENLQVFQDTMTFIPPNELIKMGSQDVNPPVGSQYQVINGINITALNLTYKVSPKMGFVCSKSEFNTTKYGMGGQTVKGYNSSVRLLVLDNLTAGTYDTLVINQTLGGTGKSGLVTVTSLNGSSANRTIIIQNATLGGPVIFSLWEIRECPDVALINESTSISSGYSNNWAGQHQRGQWFTVPFKVMKGSTAVPSAAVGIGSAIAQNDMGGSRGGMGYAGLLTAENLSVNSQISSTNARGLGFANLTIQNSGQFSLFWNLTVGADTDAASFESGIYTEIKGFRVESQSLSSGTPGKSLVMNWTPAGAELCGSGLWCYNASNFFNSSGNGNLTLINYNSTPNETLYIGRWVLASDGTGSQYFAVNNTSSVWYFTYAPNSFVIRVANNPQYDAGPSAQIYSGTVNNSFNVGVDATFGQLNVGLLNRTTRTLYIQFYNSPNQAGSGNHRLSSALSNVSVKACAVSFGSRRTPIVGANMTFYTQQWSMGGQTLTNLSVYDAVNGSLTTSPQETGPTGCVSALIAPPNGEWPSSFAGGNELRVKSYNSTNVETGWGGMIERYN